MMTLINNLNRTINDKAKDIEALKVKTSKVKGIDADKVDLIAERLVSKFKSPESWEFYCLIAWYVPEREIWLMAETAEAKATRSAGGYFNALAKKALRRQGFNLKSNPNQKVEVEYQSELVPEDEPEAEDQPEDIEILDLDELEDSESDEASYSDDEPINLDDIPF